jgi:hypothetical protein
MAQPNHHIFYEVTYLILIDRNLNIYVYCGLEIADMDRNRIEFLDLIKGQLQVPMF